MGFIDRLFLPPSLLPLTSCWWPFLGKEKNHILLWPSSGQHTPYFWGKIETHGCQSDHCPNIRWSLSGKEKSYSNNLIDKPSSHLDEDASSLFLSLSFKQFSDSLTPTSFSCQVDYGIDAEKMRLNRKETEVDGESVSHPLDLKEHYRLKHLSDVVSMKHVADLGVLVSLPHEKIKWS